MNNESPLIPQGSLLEQKVKSRSRVKTAFFCVLAVHVLAILTALIAQGCKREQPQLSQEPPPPAPTFDTNTAPMVDTNVPPPSVTTNIQPPVIEQLPPPAAAQTHTVAKGDSFYSIAKKYGTTMKAVADANPGVDSTKLKIGKTLNIPAPAAPPTGGAAAPAPNAKAGTGGQTYTVVSHDTLSKIATKFGTTLKALRAANPNVLKTDRIKVGDKLKIPVKAAAPAAPEPAPVAAPVIAPTAPPASAPTATPPAR